MSSLASLTRWGFDPTRLTFPGGTPSFTDSGPVIAPPFVQIEISAGGSLQIVQGDGPGANYNASNGSWWGRVGVYSIAGSLAGFPGVYYETRITLVSGSFTIVPASLGTFVRLTTLTSYNFSNPNAGTTETGTVRITFRRFGTSVNLGTQDFALTLTCT